MRAFEAPRAFALQLPAGPWHRYFALKMRILRIPETSAIKCDHLEMQILRAMRIYILYNSEIQVQLS
jgi:hypothetical protein